MRIVCHGRSHRKNDAEQTPRPHLFLSRQSRRRRAKDGLRMRRRRTHDGEPQSCEHRNALGIAIVRHTTAAGPFRFTIQIGIPEKLSQVHYYLVRRGIEDRQGNFHLIEMNARRRDGNSVWLGVQPVLPR